MREKPEPSPLKTSGSWGMVDRVLLEMTMPPALEKGDRMRGMRARA
jgi:hypothetical protein